MELKDTEKRLIEAVSKVIEEEGFTKIGINRIARQAQCDKVLIYRYFGGLDGLLVAWAKQYDFYSFAYSEFISQVEQATKSNLQDIIKSGVIKTAGIFEEQSTYARIICLGIIRQFLI